MTTTVQNTNQTEQKTNFNLLKNRFREYFPVIIDVETAGFHAKTDALLEIAAVTLKMDDNGFLQPDEKCHFHIEPFSGANINPDSLKFNGIDIERPSNTITDAPQGVTLNLTKEVTDARITVTKSNDKATEGTKLKRNPFHPFGTFDTATLGAFMFGQNVLIKACQAAKIPFDSKQAHSALYDTEKTAELFCFMVNHLKNLGGFPLFTTDDQ